MKNNATGAAPALRTGARDESRVADLPPRFRAEPYTVIRSGVTHVSAHV